MALSLKNRFNQAVAGFIAGQAQRRREATDIAMMDAIRRGDDRALEAAIAKGANVNICYGGKQPDNAHSPLQFAALRGNLAACERLAAAGALVDGERINDLFGTPLTSAAQNGHEAVLRFLLSTGANINQKNYTRTALHEAVLHEQRGAIHALLDAGADMQTRDRMGATPFEDALKLELFDIAENMIDRGLDLSSTNDAGLTMRELLDTPEYKPVKDYVAAKAAAEEAAAAATRQNEIDLESGLARVHQLQQPVRTMRPVQFRRA